MNPHLNDRNTQTAALEQPDFAVPSEPAAAYIRMSTDYQKYSTFNQMEVIHGFARRRNWQVVREYADEGKTGLKIDGRGGLCRLITDVLSRKADFKHILVYDVSRWGRFLDPDEAAHYEFLCRQAGVAVHYCAEEFADDGSLVSSVIKDFKRAMAAEYSRELSVKVFRGAVRMVGMGFKQGGQAVFGLRRLRVDQNGLPQGILNFGERKCLQTDRVLYIPGPPAEVQAVRSIFEMFAGEQRGATEIVRRLNERGIVAHSGQPWSVSKIRSLLNNEMLIGNLMYARTSSKLRSRLVPNPPEKWVRRENAFEGVVPRELFFKAQEVIAANRRKFRFSDESMLEKLGAVLREQGRLSARLLARLKKTPPPGTFRARFGSLGEAYRRVGFKPRRDDGHLAVSSRLFKLNRQVIDGIISQIRSRGANACWDGIHHLLLINQELRVWVIFLRHNPTFYGTARWNLRRHSRAIPSDVTLAVRMDAGNERILDYYLLPATETMPATVQLTGPCGDFLGAYRFATLDFLVGMAARTKIPKRYERRN